jgi:hypothetical protein
VLVDDGMTLLMIVMIPISCVPQGSRAWQWRTDLHKPFRRSARTVTGALYGIQQRVSRQHDCRWWWCCELLRVRHRKPAVAAPSAVAHRGFGPSLKGRLTGFWTVLAVIATNFETDYKGKERARRTVAVAGALLSGVMYRSGRLV